MDVLYFLKERTRLIRNYYEHAARPLNEIVRKIEADPDGHPKSPTRGHFKFLQLTNSR
jgi:hypothetical protein